MTELPILHSPRALLSEELLRIICDALENGTTRRAACAAAGITHTTFYGWLNDYPAVLDAVSRAEAVCQQRMEAKLVKAADNDWRASAFWLERRRRAEYGQQIDLRAVPTERLVELIGGAQDEAEWPTIQRSVPALEADCAELPDPPAQGEGNGEEGAGLRGAS